MSGFDPKKLSINLIPPATFNKPIQGRKYTLTHSDITAQLFLDVGYVYNFKSINPNMRDEVVAEWVQDALGSFHLAGKAYVDNGEYSQKVAGIRFNIFKKEMDIALNGIVYGDRPFYANYPTLLDAPIYIYYESSYPQYKQVFYYGTPRLYLSEMHLSP